MKLDHSIVEDYVRFEFTNASVKYEDKVFSEFFIFTDHGFLTNFFDFPILAGRRDALSDKKSIAISKDMAIKYFADEDPLGKELSFKFPNGKITRFIVGVVLDQYPDESSFGHKFYIPIDNFFDINPDEEKGWDYMTDATFLLLQKGSSSSQLEESFPKYVETQNNTNPEWRITGFKLFNLPDISTNSFQISSSVIGGSHPASRLALAFVAGLLLLLASFNYMNISIASSTKRLREIAIRKVMGGLRKNLIHQFMLENMLLSFFALIMGTLLSYFLFLPGFNEAIPITIPFKFSSPLTAIWFFGGLMLVITFLSGAYPSIFISKFKPISIMSGNEKIGQKTLFSKILLGFQFCFSFVTIVGSLVFTEQAMIFENKDWGYDPANIFSLSIYDKSNAERFKAEMLKNPNVVSVPLSNGQIGLWNSFQRFDHLGSQYQTVHYKVDENYFETLNLRSKEGRWLTGSQADQQQNVVVNEVFVEKMAWDDPINQSFTIDTVRRTVVGVVQDFVYDDFYSKLDAVLFSGLGDNKPTYVTIKTTPNSISSVDEEARQSWFDIAPNDPYERKYQEDVFDYFFQENQANIAIMVVICIIAIILASLGLYGLLSFNIQRRLKKFSIRKVLGAGPKTIISIAGKQYLIIVLIAFVIGASVGYMWINQLVTSIFPDPSSTGPLPFIVSISVVIVIIVLTIGGQIYQAMKVNPVDNLRHE